MLKHVNLSKEIKKSAALVAAMTVALSFVVGSFAYVNAEEILEERAANEVESLLSDVSRDAISADDIIEPELVGDEYVASSDTVYAEVPLEAEDGLYLHDYDSDVRLSMSLPEEIEFESDGISTDDMVVYNEDDVAVAVDVLDGAIRQTYVIKDKDAPKEFTVDYEGTEGLAYLEFAKDDDGNTDGSVLLRDIGGNAISAVDIPWAKDADGNDVPTHYEIDGLKLTQVVEPNADAQYPIVADPLSITSYFYSSKWTSSGKTVALSLDPKPSVRVAGPAILFLPWGFMISNAIRKASWDSIQNTYKRHNNWSNPAGMKMQYECHLYFAFWKGGTYNLEPWRRNVNWGSMIWDHHCNPPR
ncbi:MAG: DUF2599 domain-containing protein [Bifidobacteriaceae bacterium]|jgi:hypothetical protein|nr:DUF2599 domain-containing protein [Bifidobacteriaceae bacterium]